MGLGTNTNGSLPHGHLEPVLCGASAKDHSVGAHGRQRR